MIRHQFNWLFIEFWLGTEKKTWKKIIMAAPWLGRPSKKVTNFRRLLIDFWSQRQNYFRKISPKDPKNGSKKHYIKADDWEKFIWSEAKNLKKSPKNLFLMPFFTTLKNIRPFFLFHVKFMSKISYLGEKIASYLGK